MQAEKLILETDENGCLIRQPKLPVNARIDIGIEVFEGPVVPRQSEAAFKSGDPVASYRKPAA